MKRVSIKLTATFFFSCIFPADVFCSPDLSIYFVCFYCALQRCFFFFLKKFFFKFTINNYGLAAEINYLVNFVMATTEIDL